MAKNASVKNEERQAKKEARKQKRAELKATLKEKQVGKKILIVGSYLATAAVSIGATILAMKAGVPVDAPVEAAGAEIPVEVPVVEGVEV